MLIQPSGRLVVHCAGDGPPVGGVDQRRDPDLLRRRLWTSDLSPPCSRRWSRWPSALVFGATPRSVSWFPCGPRGARLCACCGGSKRHSSATSGLSARPNISGFHVGPMGHMNRWGEALRKYRERFTANRSMGLGITGPSWPSACWSCLSSGTSCNWPARATWGAEQDFAVRRLLFGPHRWIPWRWLVQAPSDFALPLTMLSTEPRGGALGDAPPHQQPHSHQDPL